MRPSFDADQRGKTLGDRFGECPLGTLERPSGNVGTGLKSAVGNSFFLKLR
jgi:hypothetical protein